MKIDPYKHKERYLKWKEKAKNEIPKIGSYNSDLLKKYLQDMEKGINVASCSIKGPRGFNRLNTLKDRFIFFCKKFKELYNLNKIIDVKEEQLISFFSDMESGIIKKENGGQYKSIDTLSRIFKAFWHWHIKTSKKQGKEVLDITIDLSTRQEKPKWVYLTEKEVKALCNKAKYEYRVLIMFLFDTGIRSPTELVNVKVSDFYNDFKELQIREETSKTFGRRIKLMLCSELIKDYIKSKNLSPDDFLFKISPSIANRYLKRLAKKIFGDKESPAGAKYSELTMYDFRHISCCYWLPRYKSESALKYRFGWKKSDKIHYYSELLGMKDTISEEDMLVDVTKTEIEKRLMSAEKRSQMLEEDNKMIHKQMSEILELFRLFKNKFEIYEQVKANRQQVEAN